MSTVHRILKVEGMTCPKCTETVRGILEKLPGIDSVEVSLEDCLVSLNQDRSLITEAEMDRALQKEGYSLAREGGKGKRIAAALSNIVFPVALALLIVLVFQHTPLRNLASAFPAAEQGMSLGAVFLTGLATSLHCITMCGGLCMTQTAGSERPVRSSLLYNAGRLLSYTVLGGIIGAAGSVLALTNTAKALIQMAAAVFMLLMALYLLGAFRWLGRLLYASGPVSKACASLSGRAGVLKAKGPFLLGLANGLMPCGPLQAMQLYALSTGTWWTGALSMFCFCLGTLPLMAGFGLLSGALSSARNVKIQKPMRMLSCCLILVMGISTLTNGLSLLGVNYGQVSGAEASGAAEENGIQHVRSELDYGDYPTITVRAGMPVQWNLHVDSKKLNTCNGELVIPAFGIDVKLEPGDNIISFTPEEAGTIPYTCWMGMLDGLIEVV